MPARVALILGLCLLPGLAAAQTPSPGRPEVLGSVSAGTLWDDESKIGLGVVIGAGAGYRWKRVGVEGRVERFSHERTFLSGVHFEARGTRFLGQLSYYWSDGRTQPFVGGVFGAIKVKRRNESPLVQPGPTGAPVLTGTQVSESEDTDRVWGGTGGVRIRLSDRLALRPEAGLLFSVPNNFIDLRFGVTAVISW